MTDVSQNGPFADAANTPKQETGDLAASVELLTMDELEELLRAVNGEITRRQEEPR